MSHYKPYPAYKDSGVEWLGRVPEHWQIKRLKHIANVQTGVAKGKDNADKETIEVPYLRVANVQDGYLSLDDVATIEIPREDLPRYSLQPGDVLMNEGGDFDKLGRGSVWQGEIEPCIHQNHVFAVRPTAVPSAWLNAFTGSLAAQFYFMGRAKQSTNLASISSSNIMELPVAMPPAAEMDLLLDHIDRETARIDALVAKKTRFIELLREKRQALITHAVTKGLDPNVKMKDSGVEWLGEVPEHWEIKRLQFLCASIKAGPFGSALTKDMYVPDGYRVYGQEQVIPGDFSIGDYYITPEYFSELAQYAVQPGDVLVSCVGTFGKIAVVPEDVEPGIINPRLIRIRVNQLVSPVYLTVLMQSSVVFEQFSLWSRGGTMDVINIGTLSGIVLSVPPASEQKAIIRYVEHEAGRIDALVNKTERSIELLKERRSALITAAVTGQIDLREAV